MSPVADQQSRGHWDPTDLSSAERRMWRRQVAARFLLNELDRSPGFWREVQLVSDSPAPVSLALRIAGSYRLNGRNRATLARIILQCSLATDHKDRRWELITSALATTFRSREQRGARFDTYLPSESFNVPMRRAAAALVSRGASDATRSEIRRLLEHAMPVLGWRSLPDHLEDDLEG